MKKKKIERKVKREEQVSAMSEGHGSSTSSQSAEALSSIDSSVAPMDTQPERATTVSSSNAAPSLGRLIKKPNCKSPLWANFKVYEKDTRQAHCCIEGCKSPDFKISDGSTGHLQRHLTAHHRDLVKTAVETEVRQFHDIRNSNDSTSETSSSGGTKRTLDGFVTLHHAPNFLTYVDCLLALFYYTLIHLIMYISIGTGTP